MDPWLDGLWKAIREALSKMNSDSSSCVKGEAEDSCKETGESPSLDVQLNHLSVTDQNDSQQQCGKTIPQCLTSQTASPAQPAVSDVGPVSPTRSSELTPLSSDAASALTSGAELQKDQAELSHSTLVASLTRSLPPLSESTLNVPVLPSPYLEVSLQQAETTERVN